MLRNSKDRCPWGPAGRGPFPTLCLQSLHRYLDPYPAVSFWCTCSLVPKGLRPHLTAYRFGTPNDLRNATSTKNDISGLRFNKLTALGTVEGQSFLYVQAPIPPGGTRPPGCTYR